MRIAGAAPMPTAGPSPEGRFPGDGATAQVAVAGSAEPPGAS
jgi:hypothetical protein